MIYAGPYTGAYSCTGGPTPGAKALMAWYLARYALLGARNDGIYNCRAVRGGDTYSVHAEGRAADLGHPVGASWVAALAEQMRQRSVELGIQCIISERRIWSSKYPDRWRDYPGVDPHTGHIHVELTWAAARSLTTAQIVAAMPATTSQVGSGLPNVQEDEVISDDDVRRVRDAVLTAPIGQSGVNLAQALERTDPAYLLLSGVGRSGLNVAQCLQRAAAPEDVEAVAQAIVAHLPAQGTVTREDVLGAVREVFEDAATAG